MRPIYVYIPLYPWALGTFTYFYARKRFIYVYILLRPIHIYIQDHVRPNLVYISLGPYVPYTRLHTVTLT